MTDTLAPPVDDIDDLISSNIADVEPGTDLCEVCGTPLYYSGRGRHPRFCDQHKPGSKPKAETGTSTRTSSKNLNLIREGFQSNWQLVAMVVGTSVNQVDGQILFGGEPKLTNAVVHLAEVNPRFRAAMLKFLEASVYGEIAVALAPMALMIAANHNMVRIPEPMLATLAAQLGFKLGDARATGDE